MRTVLITGGTGCIGSRVLLELLKLPVRLILPTRHFDNLQKGLPSDISQKRVIIEEGHISEPIWVEGLLTKYNVEAVFLYVSGPNELLVTLNFLNAMRRAGTVKYLIYVSLCGDFISPDGISHLMENCSASNILIKSTIEQKLSYRHFPWTTTVLGPSFLFGIDERSRHNLIHHGFFDEPFGSIGVSRASVNDVAVLARHIFDHPEKYSGQKIMIGSLHRYTDEEICRLWSNALRKTVQMRGNDDGDLQEFEHHYAGVLMRSGMYKQSKGAPRELRLEYELIAKIGLGMTEEQYEAQVNALGRDPEDYETWIVETSEKWSQNANFFETIGRRLSRTLSRE